MWALYIVIGSRVAQIGRGVAGLGIGLAIGAVAITPIGAPGSGHVFTTPRLLVGCVAVGVFSNAIGYGIDQTCCGASRCAASPCSSRCCR